MSIKNINNIFSILNVDNIKDFVNKYLIQIIYAICFVFIIVFFSIYMINKNSDSKKKLLVDYYKATNYIKNNQNEEAFDILKNIYYSKYADQNLKTISGVRLGEMFLSKNKISEALSIYKEIYTFSDNNEFLKNLSGLAVLNIMINQNDPKDYNEIEALIQKLSSPQNPVLILVNEQQGIFEIQRGNKEKGFMILKETLKQNDLDEESKTRIESIIGLYKNEDI